uniref:Chloride channel CLIC-like protein 1 n=1 Tax=Syphacia muris TaxID=451379 RepID=A0A0N5B0X5_9BILA
MLRHLNVDIDRVNVIHKKATVYLGSYGVKTLRSYLSGGTDTLSEREQIRDLLENFIVQESVEVDDDGYWTSLLKAFVPYLPILNVIVLPPAVFFLLYNLRIRRSFISFIFPMLFSISFGTVYYRTYQKNVASRLARSHLSLSEKCKPKGFFSWCLSWLTVRGKDECLQLHEDMYVDPFFEISPLDVLSEVVTNFILTPLSSLGQHLNSFFTNFYYNTPIFLAGVKTMFIIIFPLLMMFWLCGYRLRTVFATVEPAVIPCLCRNEESSALGTTAPVELVFPNVNAKSKDGKNELLLSSFSKTNSGKCMKRRRTASAGSRY